MIGYDARHNSDVFAADTAEVMTGAGLRGAACCPGRCPRRCSPSRSAHLGCVAGVMVTASHNPPQDNGYKVYLGDGSQIVPPADAEIAARDRRRRRRSPTCPRGDGWRGARRRRRRPLPRHASPALAGDGPRDLTHRLHAAARRRRRDGRRRRCERAGFAAPHVVAAAGASPTRTSRPSPSPTPRSRARWTSRWRSPREVDADLVVANDPDADRCAVAVPGAARLADAARRRGRRAARPTTCCGRGATGVYATLDRVLVAARQDGRGRRAAVRRDAHRLQVDRPRRRASRSATRRRSATASTPTHVRTRTASPRCCWSCELAAAAEGRGPHAASTGSTTSPASTACTPPTSSRCGSTTSPLIAGGDGPAARRARRPRSAGSRSSRSTTSPQGVGGPAADRRAALPARRAAPGSIVRPSGTEPKLKCYLEVVVPVEDADGRRRRRPHLRRRPARRDPGRRQAAAGLDCQSPARRSPDETSSAAREHRGRRRSATRPQSRRTAERRAAAASRAASLARVPARSSSSVGQRAVVDGASRCEPPDDRD